MTNELNKEAECINTTASEWYRAAAKATDKSNSFILQARKG